MAQSLPVFAIGDISVRQLDGLYSLNDLHKASGGNPSQRPGEFMRLEQTQALIAAIETAGIPAVKTKEGRNGGTYTARKVVIAYAAWVNATFHLKVIRVFLDAVQPARPHNPAIDYDRISPVQAQDLKELVHSVVDSKVQGFGETWARLHKKFRVNSYLELPAARFDEARDYLLGKLPPEAQHGADAPTAPPLDPLNGPALVAARQVAEDYFESYRQAVQSGQPTPPMGEMPPEVLHGIMARALCNQRMLTWFNWDTGTMDCKLIPSDSSVFSLASGNYTDLLQQVPMERLPEMAEAVNRRVARHLGAFQAHLQRSSRTAALAIAR